MKIYTGTGDRGKTSLFSGERVSKRHLQIETYGDLDELNSIMGALIASIGSEHLEQVEELQRLQSDLFTIGAILATTPNSPAMHTIDGIAMEQIEMLENATDQMQEMLPQLKGFLLPGGHATAAWAHVARTVCRRTERHLVRFLETLQGGNGVEPYQIALIYLNRLSDYFFVAARYFNHIQDIPDKLWKK